LLEARIVVCFASGAQFRHIFTSGKAYKTEIVSSSLDFFPHLIDGMYCGCVANELGMIGPNSPFTWLIGMEGLDPRVIPDRTLTNGFMAIVDKWLIGPGTDPNWTAELQGSSIVWYI
jgi:hypothetical protein